MQQSTSIRGSVSASVHPLRLLIFGCINVLWSTAWPVLALEHIFECTKTRHLSIWGRGWQGEGIGSDEGAGKGSREGMAKGRDRK